MSVSVALQEFIRMTLVADPVVAALVDDRVYDNVPKDPRFPYVSFGPDDVLDDGAECIAAREETVQIDIWSRRHGKLAQAKSIRDAIRAALNGITRQDLGPAGLVEMRIDGARVFREPDLMTAHGVVTVTALIDE